MRSGARERRGLRASRGARGWMEVEVEVARLRLRRASSLEVMLSPSPHRHSEEKRYVPFCRCPSPHPFHCLQWSLAWLLGEEPRGSMQPPILRAHPNLPPAEGGEVDISGQQRPGLALPVTVVRAPIRPAKRTKASEDPEKKNRPGREAEEKNRAPLPSFLLSLYISRSFSLLQTRDR